MPVPHCLDFLSCKIRKCESSTLFFFDTILTVLDHLYFPIAKLSCH